MRILKIALIFLLIFSFCSCGIKTENSKDAPNENEYTRQYLSKNVISVFNSENRDWMTVDLSEVGLNNLTVGCVENGYFDTEHAKSPAYIFCDYAISNDMYHIPYLAVVLNDKVLIKDLSDGNKYNGSYYDTLYIADVDGDGIDEIIIQQTVGMSGGAGSYVSRIFKVNEEKITEMFNSILQGSSDSAWSVWDTGFTSEFLSGYQLKISNRFTGYHTTLDISKKYTADFFDQDGKGKQSVGISCDSFREFIPQDIDDDGIYEIVCLQYVSLSSHSDYIGNVKTVLKYNINHEAFEVVQAEFRET